MKSSGDRTTHGGSKEILPYTTWKRDLFLILVVTSIIFLLLSYYSTNNEIQDISEEYDTFHIVDGVVAISITSLFLYFFARRRRRELAQEYKIRRETETRLRWKQTNYSTLVGAVTEGIVVFDAQGRITQANPVAIANLGIMRQSSDEQLFLRPDSVFLRSDGSTMPFEEMPTSRAIHRRVAIPNQQMGFRKADGSTIWFIVNAVPSLDPDGTLLGVTSSFTDVTDLIIAEEEKARAVTTNAVLEAMGDGLVVLNMEGRITAVNRAFERMTGFSREELIGIFGANFITNIIKIEKDEDAIVKIKESIEGTTDPYGAIILQKKSGEEVPTAITASYMRGEGGEPRAIITTFKDISNVLMLEDALRNSNERFQRITAYANDAIFLVDDKGRVNYWNPASEKIFGYSKVEAEGKKLTQLIVPTHLREQLTERMLTPQLPEAEPFIRKTVETIAKRKSGEEFIIELSFSILIIKGSFHTIGIVRDVSERKAAERALVDSEERQKALFEGGTDPISLVGLDDRIIKINPAMERIFGYSEAELIGKPFPGHAGIDPGKFEEWLEACRQGIGVSGYETVRRHQQGHLIPVSITVSPVHDSDGYLVSLSFWYRDITDQKRTEEQLRFQAHLLDSVRESVIATDLDGRITYWGHGAEALYQYSSEEAQGQLIYHFIDPGNMEEEPRWKETLETGSWSGEYTQYRKDGSSFLARASLYRIQDPPPSDQPIGFIAIYRDITNLKKTEDALRESEVRYRTVSETVFAGLTIVDTNDALVFVNSAFAEMLGYTIEELLGMSIFQITDKDEFSSHQKTSADEDESRTSYETTVILKDGTITNVLIAVSPLTSPDGTFTGTLCVFIDISERIKSEERIKSSLTEKEVLLKEIHHRVKNNLQVVSSLLYLQSEQLKDQYGRDMLKQSQNRVKSMALVHERLYQSDDLAKIDFAEYIRNLSAHLFHSYGLDPRRIILNTIVEEVFLSIETAIPCGLIINELVSNALKHGFPDDNQGEITIRLTMEPEDHLTLVIHDDGVGLPESVDFRDTESMGLHLVMTLVRQIGATIELDSTGGTKYEIVFEAD